MNELVGIEEMQYVVGDIISNLKNEIKELGIKVEKARKEENWGTYKNLIIAYKEIVKLYNDISECLYLQKETEDKISSVHHTISLDMDILKLVKNSIEYVVKSNNKDVAKEEKQLDDYKIIKLFGENDSGDLKLDNNNVYLNFNMTDMLDNKIWSCYSNSRSKGEVFLIDVSNVRCVGKTYSLINFAKKFGYIVIIPNESQAIDLRNEYDYGKIYGQTSSQLIGVKNTKCVIDEGVDVNRIKNELELDIVAGYVISK